MKMCHMVHFKYVQTSWIGAALVAQTVKNPPAMQETHIQSLGWEDPLEKEMAAHSNILASRILYTEEPGGLQSMGSQRHNWETNTHTHTHTLLEYTKNYWLIHF